jgi:hypothetical protein
MPLHARAVGVGLASVAVRAGAGSDDDKKAKRVRRSRRLAAHAANRPPGPDAVAGGRARSPPWRHGADGAASARRSARRRPTAAVGPDRCSSRTTDRPGFPDRAPGPAARRDPVPLPRERSKSSAAGPPAASPSRSTAAKRARAPKVGPPPARRGPPEAKRAAVRCTSACRAGIHNPQPRSIVPPRARLHGGASAPDPPQTSR